MWSAIFANVQAKIAFLDFLEFKALRVQKIYINCHIYLRALCGRRREKSIFRLLPPYVCQLQKFAHKWWQQDWLESNSASYHKSDNKIGRWFSGVRFVITSLITDRIGRHEVLLPTIHKNYNFREKKNSQVILNRPCFFMVYYYLFGVFPSL